MYFHCQRSNTGMLYTDIVIVKIILYFNELSHRILQYEWEKNVETKDFCFSFIFIKRLCIWMIDKYFIWDRSDTSVPIHKSLKEFVFIPMIIDLNKILWFEDEEKKDTKLIVGTFNSVKCILAFFSMCGVFFKTY